LIPPAAARSGKLRPARPTPSALRRINIRCFPKTSSGIFGPVSAAPRPRPKVERHGLFDPAAAFINADNGFGTLAGGGWRNNPALVRHVSEVAPGAGAAFSIAWA